MTRWNSSTRGHLHLGKLCSYSIGFFKKSCSECRVKSQWMEVWLVHSKFPVWKQMLLPFAPLKSLHCSSSMLPVRLTIWASRWSPTIQITLIPSYSTQSQTTEEIRMRWGLNNFSMMQNVFLFAVNWMQLLKIICVAAQGVQDIFWKKRTKDWWILQKSSFRWVYQQWIFTAPEEAP